RSGQAERLRLAVQLTPSDAGLRADRPSRGIDPDALHARQVDDQPAIADAGAGEAVGATAHRHQQGVVTGEVDSVDDIGYPGGPDDQARTAVDIRVPDLARLFVATVVRSEKLAAQGLLELVDGSCRELDLVTSERRNAKVRHGFLLDSSVGDINLFSSALSSRPRPSFLRESPLARLLGLHLAHGGTVRRQHDAERCDRQRRRYLPVQHVGEHSRGVAIQRVAVAGAARDVLPELVTRVKDDHLLGQELLAGAVRSHDVRVCAGARRPAFETPGRRAEALAAMGDHDVGRRLEHLLEAEATAEAPGAARVYPQPRAPDAQREVHLDRLDGDVHAVRDVGLDDVDTILVGARAHAA